MGRRVGRVASWVGLLGMLAVSERRFEPVGSRLWVAMQVWMAAWSAGVGRLMKEGRQQRVESARVGFTMSARWCTRMGIWR